MDIYADRVSTATWVTGLTLAALLTIAFGYLPAPTAARKGYNLWVFLAFGTIALFPAVVVAGLLRDKTQVDAKRS